MSLMFLAVKAANNSKWMSATNWNIHYPRCKVRNCWHSVDDHSQNWAVSVLLSLLPINAANTSVMHNSEQITVQLPYLQDHKSLRLCWRPFQCIVHSTSGAIDNCFHHDLNILVVFLTDWDSALWQSWAQEHSCTVRSHRTRSYLSCQMIHCACYTSVYQPIVTSYCLPFAHNISLTETLGQAT